MRLCCQISVLVSVPIILVQWFSMTVRQMKHLLARASRCFICHCCCELFQLMDNFETETFPDFPRLRPFKSTSRDHLETETSRPRLHPWLGPVFYYFYITFNYWCGKDHEVNFMTAAVYFDSFLVLVVIRVVNGYPNIWILFGNRLWNTKFGYTNFSCPPASTERYSIHCMARSPQAVTDAIRVKLEVSDHTWFFSIPLPAHWLLDAGHAGRHHLSHSAAHAFHGVGWPPSIGVRLQRLQCLVLAERTHRDLKQ